MEKMYLYRLDILGDIVKMLEIFKFDPGVISEVFGVITCLSNVTTFIEALDSKAVHKQVGVCKKVGGVCNHSDIIYMYTYAFSNSRKMNH